MATLQVRDFPEDLLQDLKIASLRAKLDLKEFVPQLIADALKAKKGNK